MELVFAPRNKVELLSSSFSVSDGSVKQGQTVGLSIFRFSKSDERGILLYDEFKNNVWKAKLSVVNYEESNDERMVTFHDTETSKIFPVRFVTAEERSKTVAHFQKSQQIRSKGKGEMLHSDSDEEVLNWDGSSDLDDMQRCLTVLAERVRQLENAYQTEFAVGLTTETVSAVWLRSKEILENANVPSGTQQTLQSSMVSYAAQKNSERANLRPEMTLADSRAATQQELARLRDLLGHFRFVHEQKKNDGQKESRSNKNRVDSNSDDERAAREDDIARAKGRGLANAIQAGGGIDAADLPRREGWLEFKSGSKWKKVYCKTSGRYFYAFRARGDTIPKLSLPLRGSRVGNSEGLVMVISTPGTIEKKLYFKASSNEEYNDWVYAISIITGQ